MIDANRLGYSPPPSREERALGEGVVSLSLPVRSWFVLPSIDGEVLRVPPSKKSTEP